MFGFERMLSISAAARSAKLLFPPAARELHVWWHSAPTVMALRTAGSKGVYNLRPKLPMRTLSFEAGARNNSARLSQRPLLAHADDLVVSTDHASVVDTDLQKPLEEIAWRPDLVNTASLIGRVGRDPTIKYLSDGKCVVSFSLAVNKSRNREDGANWYFPARPDPLPPPLHRSRSALATGSISPFGMSSASRSITISLRGSKSQFAALCALRTGRTIRARCARRFV